MDYMIYQSEAVPDFIIMSSIPQGCFAAKKCREYMNKTEPIKEIPGKSINFSRDDKSDLLPLKYNSKMMNSIWGQYNRYSVHNVKQHTDRLTGMMKSGSIEHAFL